VNKILIINTGGTFNKKYDPIKGELKVPDDSKALESILKYFHNLKYEIKNIVHKDSLDIDDINRKEIVEAIKNSKQKSILIIHGTDTMCETAEFLEKYIEDRVLLITGAMTPFSINPIEATANLSASLGYLLGIAQNGVYLSMHGLIKEHSRVFKNRKIGIFEEKK